jgi:hypothetical protein
VGEIRVALVIFYALEVAKIIIEKLGTGYNHFRLIARWGTNPNIRIIPTQSDWHPYSSKYT